MRRAFVVLVVLLTSAIAPAQDTKVQTANVRKTSTTQADKPKLAEQQKRGLSLLESAEGAAGGFEAPSRIVAYTQIARVYQTRDKKKAVQLLQQAYESLRTLQLDSPNERLNMQVKNQLQQQVLNQFASLAPERVDGFIDQMQPPMRITALQVLLPYYEKTKTLDRPVSVLMQLAVEAEMPYGIVNDVIDKLGNTHPDQVRELFLASLTSYQNHEHLELSASTDFANLIGKAYGKVPDESVETTIDELLSQAKKADEKNANVSISLGFDKGAMQFKSIYDTQLFAVLPTLEQVDPEKAKRLLKENEDVSTFASKYPGGMNSLSPNGRPSSIGIHTGNSAAADAQSPHVMEQQRLNAVMKDADDHPDDALANAATLSPNTAMMAYMGIARANVKKNSTVAEIALDKAQDLVPKLRLFERMPTITEMANLHEQLGDNENAAKVIDLGTKAATELFKQEMDADDPNLAPKAYWVSTNAWRNLVDASYNLNPGQAFGLLKEAPDDEVRAFAQISLAKRLLGSTSHALDFSMSANKKGMMMTSMTTSEDNGEAK